jgi:hypothetical protein
MTASDQVPTFRNRRTVVRDEMLGVVLFMMASPDFQGQAPRRPTGTSMDENSGTRSAHSGVLRKDRPER